MRIAPAHFKIIEHELFNYDNTKAEVSMIKDEIIDAPPLPMSEQVNIVRGGVSNPTLAKTEKLLSNAVLAHMDRTVRAIDRALIMLDEQHHEIFDLRYRQGKNWREIVTVMPISERHYFRKRREIIITVAVQLGYISP